MPWFEYDGLTAGGTAIAGRIESPSREQAIEELRGMAIEVRELNESTAPPKRAAKLGEEDLIFFNQQLASLAEAGIALDDGLAQLARDVDSPRLRRWIEGVVADLRFGKPVDQAIAAHEQGLPLLYSRVIRAGIDSGELSATLLNLNQHLHLAAEMRRMVWELASYPLLVLTLAVTIMSGVFVFVIPMFHDIFSEWGIRLPAITELMFKIAFNYAWIMLTIGIVLVVIVLVWQSLRRTPGGLRVREGVIMGIPVAGRVYRASLVARFLRAISTAVASGVPLPQAMRLAGGATGSQCLIEDAERLARELEHGQSIFTAGRSARIIPPLFGFCAEVATGRDALPVAMSQLAHSYENRAIHLQSVLRTLLFPLLVVVLGGFLVFIIAGMFLPLISLINSVSGGM